MSAMGDMGQPLPSVRTSSIMTPACENPHRWKRLFFNVNVQKTTKFENK